MLYFIKKEKVFNIIFASALLLSFFVSYPFNTLKVTSSTSLSGKIIIIDAGHGHSDGGAIGYSGIKEKDLNLIIAKKTGSYLQQLGANIIYTRYDDNTIVKSDSENNNQNLKKKDMSVRKQIRDSSGADLFISIHMNFFDDPQYKGAQVFYNDLNTESKRLAISIQNSFMKYVDPQNNRFVKDSRQIYLLNDSTIPAVLIECGFISNKYEERKLTENDYQQNIAFAICDGVINFYNNT